MPKKQSQLKRASEKKVPRKLQQPTYKSFRLQKRVHHRGPKLSGALSLWRQALRPVRQHWAVFVGILAIYVVMSLVLVQGIAGSGLLNDLKGLLEDTTNKASLSVTLFVYLLGSSGNAETDSAKVYQSILLLMVSLAIVWTLRQVYAKSAIGVRVAYYRGMYPIVPVLVVLAVMGLQLLPFVAASAVFNLVVTNGIAVLFIEKFLMGLVVFLAFILSMYMLTSSLFALVIATLPDMTPLKALRSARGLVRYRRWAIMRKIIFLPIMIYATAAIIMVPLILYATPLAEPIYFVLTSIFMLVAISYVYALYRELLNE